jgi:hypothetical protein
MRPTPVEPKLSSMARFPTPCLILSLVLVAVAGANESEFATPPKPIEILIPGVHWYKDVPNYSTDGWSALVATDSGTVLRRARLRLKPTIYNDGSDHPGIEVLADSLPTTLFFVRGLKWVKEGPVGTWFLGDWRMAPQKSLTLTTPGARKYRISTSPPIPEPKMEGFRPFRYELRLNERAIEREQALGSWNIDYSPSVRWVGDLDHDGKIDIFLFDDSPETGEAFWTLFLASHAPVSGIVGRAAQLHRTGD